jgi:hypothetical protein
MALPFDPSISCCVSEHSQAFAKTGHLGSTLGTINAVTFDGFEAGACFSADVRVAGEGSKATIESTPQQVPPSTFPFSLALSKHQLESCGIEVY